MYLGEELDSVIDAIINKETKVGIKKDRFQTGVSGLTDFSKDNNDRNRTSPFAFTGNKFEFRGVGSSQSIGLVNTVLNAILSIEMLEMAELIEKGEQPIDVIRKFLTDHKRIIFNGDGYSSEWEEEASKRGLFNIKNTVDAIQCLKENKNISLLTGLGILNEIEIESRYEISLESYCKKMLVEAATAVKMVNNQIYPAALNYLNKISNTALHLKKIEVDDSCVIDHVKVLSKLIYDMKCTVTSLELNISLAKEMKEFKAKADYIKELIVYGMKELRKIVDVIETKVDSNDWPIPTYVDLLFSL